MDGGGGAVRDGYKEAITVLVAGAGVVLIGVVRDPYAELVLA